MIVKKYVPRIETDPRLKAGVAAEKQMAHYLDRQFRESKRYYVLHDVRFEHDGENGQIDHLVVHPFGVAIVESKSVSTAVRINAMNEWERRQSRGWTGMRNPLLQAERQGMLLKSLLKTREADLLDKVLGLAQGTFSLMAVDPFVAISDSGRIQRSRRDQAPSALKADAVPAAIEEVVAGYRKASSLLTLNVKAIATVPRDFNEAERLRIARFMDAADRRWRDARSSAGAGRVQPAVEEPLVVETGLDRARETRPANRRATIRQATCKYCGSRELEPKIGKYGPYGKCRSCSKNTSVKIDCDTCRENVYMSRTESGFGGSCQGCGVEYQVQFA